MDTRLDSLDWRFRPLVDRFLARCVEHRIPVVIVNTRRTAMEQAKAMASGHSKVVYSKHQDGLAIDICPYAQYDLHGPDKLQWDTSDPVWKLLGAIGQDLGFRWGGTFKPLDRNGLGWDPGHFEMVITK